MVDIVKRYKCDVCGDEVCVKEDANIPTWTIKTEIGDLCPDCALAWDECKRAFKERMKG